MKQPQLAPLVVIVGPTASGKTALAVQAGQKFGGEIICADSRTIYKGMDIGTAKPTPEERSLVPHHLLDIIDPTDPFSAARFKQLAEETIVSISSRGKVPIMVGGTGLYVDGVIFDYSFGKPADPDLREKLQTLSTTDLQAYCRYKNIDLPINSKNRRHLIRAIELGRIQKSNRTIRRHTLVVGLTIEKAILRTRVEARAKDMFANGVVDEVARLAVKYGWGSEAMTGSIYRILRAVIAGEISEQEALSRFIQSDMQLAKRQITWFKRNPSIHWHDSPQQCLLEIEQFLKVA